MIPAAAAPPPAVEGFPQNGAGFGQFLSIWVPYLSPKFVSIKNLKLGFLYWFIVFAGAMWVFVDHALYQGLHLLEREGVGGWWASLQQPTAAGCSPDQIGCLNNYSTEMPYCDQSSSASSHHVAHPHRVLKCRNFDGDTLMKLRDNGVFVPTRVETFHMRLDCASQADCEEGLSWVYLDKDGRPQEGEGPAYPVRDVFVNDIESYTLRVDHSIQVPSRAGIVHSYHNSELQGLIDQGFCSRRTGKHHHQGHADLTALPKGPAPELEIYATPLGDVFRIGKLTELTGQNLDELVLLTPNEATSRRLSGAVLLITITYTMRVPWVGLKLLPWSDPQRLLPEYRVDVAKKRGARDTVTEEVRTGHRKGDIRTVRTFNGLRILIEQKVTVLEWNWTQVTVILTTVAIVVRITKFIFRMLIIYVLPGSATVFAAVYEESVLKLRGPQIPLSFQMTCSSESVEKLGTEGGEEDRSAFGGVLSPLG